MYLIGKVVVRREAKDWNGRWILAGWCLRSEWAKGMHVDAVRQRGISSFVRSLIVIVICFVENSV